MCGLWLRLIMKVIFDVGAVGTVVTCKASALSCVGNDLQKHVM